jgi:hypothetical protein
MQEIGLQMEQRPVNQRIKFLLDALNMSARTFSEVIGEKPSNTQNYVGTRNSMPGADYLEKILNHFENVNSIWLLTGKGEPFLSGTSTASSVSNNKKISRSLVVGHVGGNATTTQNQSVSGNEQALQRELELLRSQLADKERTIQILLNQLPKP